MAELASDLGTAFPAVCASEFTDLLRFPGVMRSQTCRTRRRLQADALALLDDALDEFVAAREREGGNLAAAIARARGRHRSDRRAGARTGAGDPRRPARQAGGAAGRPEQPVDPGRLEQELVLILQKLDVDEELDRLDSHVAEARRVLGQAEPVGRRLDFLMQEFNREANTLGSKSVDGRTTRRRSS